MLTIGVCDDQPQQVQLLLRYLNDYMASFGEDRVIASSHPVEFLQRLETEKPDLVFLDVNMDDMDGIRLGEAIRARYPDTMLVYVTAFGQYALDAFRVRAFHYLLKPIEREAFNTLMRETMDHLNKIGSGVTEKHFAVRVKGEIARFAYSEIIYFEKMGHCVVVHAQKRDISYYGNMQSLLQEMDSDMFVQCHQGYVVNLDKVRAFRDKTLKLDGGAEVPVSRSYADHVKSILVKRLFDREESL
jgi:DNA-binding LytR/AlgR family response regulator